MGSATSVSLKYNSNHRELSAAAISIHKPSIISELILEQEIDVATAMALDDDDLPFVSAKKLDQIKLKVALKQLRTYLNGHQRTLHLSHSAMQLGTTTNPTINLSTSFSQSTSFLPSSLRIGLLESITDDSQTPRDSLMVLSNLVQSENTRALVRNDLDVTSSLLISLRNYGDKMDICKSSLEILLRQCFVEENLLLVIEQNGVQLILNLLKQHESNNNSKISESCVSILWLYGAHLISKRKERKRPVGYNSDSINGSSMMMMTDAGFPMTELERKEKKDLELLVIQNILWQMVRYKENSEVLSACCLALSTNIDLNNVSLIRHLLSSESLDILFSTMKKYNYILDVIEPCVTVIEKLSIVNIDRENGSKNENENRNRNNTRFIDGIDGEIRGEDYRNEMRMLGGVHLLREVILRWPNNRILRTKAQTALNRLQAPRLRTPPKRKIKRIVSVKPMVFKMKKNNFLKSEVRVKAAAIALGSLEYPTQIENVVRVLKKNTPPIVGGKLTKFFTIAAFTMLGLIHKDKHWREWAPANYTAGSGCVNWLKEATSNSTLDGDGVKTLLSSMLAFLPESITFLDLENVACKAHVLKFNGKQQHSSVGSGDGGVGGRSRARTAGTAKKRKHAGAGSDSKKMRVKEEEDSSSSTSAP